MNLKELTGVFVVIAITVNPILAWRTLKDGNFGKQCVNGTPPEGSNRITCDHSKSMYCSNNGICECIPSKGNIPVFYDDEVRSCLLTPSEEDDFRCQTNEQCHKSSYGRYSRCNRDQGTCECYHKDKKTVVIENKCFKVESERELQFYPSCKNDYECTVTALGELSRCNLQSFKCECYDTNSNGKNEVGLYNGKCYFRRMLGEFCDNEGQCKVAHPNAECKEHHSYLPKEKTCQCPTDDDDCNKNGAGSVATTVGVLGATLLLGVVAKVVT